MTAAGCSEEDLQGHLSQIHPFLVVVGAVAAGKPVRIQQVVLVVRIVTAVAAVAGFHMDVPSGRS